ncbi:MAG: molybdopterin synthase sulfur carrier subunit [Omnitrophica WOR_2 bacterium RIFCSPHIGHO2_01_FULL_48_9]|nr:MAG: molybdopterin synthase sulfur carrier subunit [Omnitrophica WOR_2 bacterium RIFCSPHIGHO2_02_FULL_48_11]OGX31859.1 MAG: molybdopterin synthase sulfur carrier subunit [Omnitrophica WOR_2 bacterium RIFCSPHIGHO2_01_FULL_48_9]
MGKKIIHIQYYAILREQRGLNQETLETSVHTAVQLFEELKAKYHFQLPIALIKVAINNEFAAWNTEVKSGDSVAFIPPVAGG